MLYKTGLELHNLPRKERKEIADLYNKYWNSFFILTPDLVKERFEGGQTFIVGYDNGGPVALLETMTIRFFDAKELETATHERLTNGNFRNKNYTVGDKTSKILVDISGSGYGSRLLMYGLCGTAREDVDHVFTFTPNVKKVQDWHIRHGAELTDIIVKGARPGYKLPKKLLTEGDVPEDVRMLCYDPVILAIREGKNIFL